MASALLINGGALGDAILALRIVAALRQAGFERVTLLGRSPGADVFKLCSAVDRVLNLELGGFYMLFGHEPVPVHHRLYDTLQGIDLTINMLGGAPTGDVRDKLEQLTGGRVIEVDPHPSQT